MHTVVRVYKIIYWYGTNKLHTGNGMNYKLHTCNGMNYKSHTYSGMNFNLFAWMKNAENLPKPTTFQSLLL